MTASEHSIQSQIQVELSKHHCTVFRANVGKVRTPDGRFFSTGLPSGYTDLSGFRWVDGKGHKAMIVLDEINNPRFLFDGMQQTEIEASRITVLISALKIVRDFVNENLVRVDLED